MTLLLGIFFFFRRKERQRRATSPPSLNPTSSHTRAWDILESRAGRRVGGCMMLGPDHEVILSFIEASKQIMLFGMFWKWSPRASYWAMESSNNIRYNYYSSQAARSDQINQPTNQPSVTYRDGFPGCMQHGNDFTMVLENETPSILKS